jgi:acetyl-CoA acetyltransferase
MAEGLGAAIVGIYEYPERRAPDLVPFAIQAECIRGALADAGLTPGDVDGLCTAAGDVAEGGGVMSVVDLAEWLGLEPTFVDGTDTGGAAAISQIGHASAAIAAGLAEVVVVSYAATPLSPAAAARPRAPAAGAAQFELPYGPTIVGAYALAAQRHMHEFGTTPEQLAEVAVACRSHAAGNPDARFRDPIGVEDVLASPLIASPLHRLDCCVVTDGGGAVVVTSAERARDCRQHAASILGFGEACSHVSMSQMPSLTITPGAISGRRAFRAAGVTQADVGAAQVYDSFTITVVLELEDLGFCDKGEGGSFVEGGRIGPGGALPVNTDGGGLSSNHPGRRGIFTVIEAVRQLRGASAGIQVPDCEIALAHATGGTLSTAATLVLAA